MELLTPGIGLIFWMTIIFLIVLLILGKWGWPVLIKGMKKREEDIRNSLNAAEKAREEMKKLKTDNESLLLEAKKERDELLKDAKKVKEQIIEQAKEQANLEADKIIVQARENIQAEKRQAMEELKNQISLFSIEIAEKILKNELSDKQKSEKIISEELENIKFK
ncbi:MAG: F0F1 ATP synthase subunit B [Bacteroidota bacterium]|nr:F0F1 ATP synthase subunit B [Bacteroidota bacterium]